jgi:hypothetical protein
MHSIIVRGAFTLFRANTAEIRKTQEIAGKETE